MSANSKIEWTDHTFNPWIGCTKVSPGCTNCYAETRDKRHLIEKVGDTSNPGYTDAFTGGCYHPLTCILKPPRGDAGVGIDWVIAGGESGHHARPMHPDWARSLRDQCAAASVPFFFKQWGEWAPSRDVYTRAPLTFGRVALDGEVIRVGKKRAGRLLDGVEHSAFPDSRRHSAVATAEGTV